MPKFASFSECFSSLKDPRRRVREVHHPLINILTMAVCGVICGADDFVMIAHIAREKKDWFAKFLDLSNGIPSHDTFNRVLGALNPQAFEECLLSWITSLHELTGGQVVAIDGKALRHSYDRGSNKAAIHMVSAWATANQICLGQTVTDDKSNEITAIPKILELIAVEGCLVTIDAMGCQTEIAKKIRQVGGHYVLAVKANQQTLQQGLMDFFEGHLGDQFSRHPARSFDTQERSRTREETRNYYICRVPAELPDGHRWKDLKAIGIAISTFEREGKAQSDVGYYILSKYLSAKDFANAVRGHWGIENQLHWQLDVSFGEDRSRIRKGHAAENFSILRRTALALLKQDKSKQLGIKNKRIAAAMNGEYLLKVLTGQ